MRLWGRNLANCHIIRIKVQRLTCNSSVQQRELNAKQANLGDQLKLILVNILLYLSLVAVRGIISCVPSVL